MVGNPEFAVSDKPEDATGLHQATHEAGLPEVDENALAVVIEETPQAVAGNGMQPDGLALTVGGGGGLRTRASKMTLLPLGGGAGWAWPGLALLRKSVADRFVVCEPSRPENGVVQV